MRSHQGMLTGLHPLFLRQFFAFREAAAQRFNIDVIALDALRTRAEQAFLYDGWIKRLPGFNLAAPPGSSNHEKRADGYAYAIDIDPNVWQRPQLEALLDEFGLYLAVRHSNGRVREPWHIEPEWLHNPRCRAIWESKFPENKEWDEMASREEVKTAVAEVLNNEDVLGAVIGRWMQEQRDVIIAAFVATLKNEDVLGPVIGRWMQEQRDVIIAAVAKEIKANK